ncbi:MAG TPA: tryptophan synthase subunit alpha [Tepidisphaeraceae bacterium]|jgi:tryptophan synthase alpha chain|nr:tryptophan synthase subunit alpha [Tepidisphaeraceae bacterium]
MTTKTLSPIQRTFADLRARKQIALMPFITAGYPSLDATLAILPALERAGASLVEIGFPFSDPIADGPTIQESYTQVLSAGLQLKDIFRTIKQARATVTIPLVAMVSYSIVYRFGLERFLAECNSCGINGLILPDLPPPEAQAICAKVNAAGLDTILLVAPTTTSQRRKEIADLCTGFIYYLSISGITGERKSLPPDITQSLQNLRSLTDRPICVGFGISEAQHVAQLAPYADGAIVGTAFVRRFKQHQSESPQQIGKVAGDFCKELLSQVR